MTLQITSQGPNHAAASWIAVAERLAAPKRSTDGSGDTAFARAERERTIDNLSSMRKRRGAPLPAAVQNLAELAAGIAKSGHSFI